MHASLTSWRRRSFEESAFLRRLAATLLACALALGAVLPASAATISGLSATLAGTNSANSFDDSGDTRTARQSSVAVQSTGAAAFSTRYAMVVASNRGNGGGPDLTISHIASYTITFDVNALAGEAWQLVISTSRVGALTLVTDSNGGASASLGAVTGTRSGEGSLASGGLGVGAVTSLFGGAGGNAPFAQSSAAVITGVGTGAAQSVTLAFSFTASAASDNDQAAVRMGLDSALTGGFSADDYPGVGARTQANDGHLVSVVLTPEPGTGALCALGLSVLALRRSRRARSAFAVEGGA